MIEKYNLLLFKITAIIVLFISIPVKFEIAAVGISGVTIDLY